MTEQRRYYPLKGNLNEECMWWNRVDYRCGFPKFEVEGRDSCEGIIDEVCLFLTGKLDSSELDLEEEQIAKLKTTVPGDTHAIPAGPPLRLEE